MDDQRKKEKEREQQREREQAILLTPAQVCELINMGRSKIYELLASQQIPSISVGRSRRVLRDDLMAWIEKQRSRQGDDGR